jgi:hypothetical protein
MDCHGSTTETRMRMPHQRTGGSRSKAWFCPTLVAAFSWLLLFAPTASAANYTWTGSSTTSHNWSEAANWGGTAPSGTVGTLEFPELTSAACTANPATAACYETANDVSGLTVEGMSFEGPYDINQPCLVCHPAPGEGITLGAGGLKGSGVTANVPITLSAPQTWSASVDLDSVLSGEQALNLPIAHGHGDTFNGGANVGPITATGSDSADTGESASDNGTIWVGTPDPAGSGPAVLNGTDEQPVTISDLALGSNFATVGPLTMKGGDVMFGLLGASPTLTVKGGVTFDAASTLQMTINTSPGETNASQVDANGTVDLGGAHLSLSTRFGLGECDVPTGQAYTLVGTTGSLEGTFGGLPDGSTVPLQRCDGAAQALRINYTAHSVTATVVGPSFTWSGGAAPGTPNWSNATNWAGTAPSGMVGALVFPALSSGACTAKPATGTCYSSTNDVSGLEVGAILLDNAAPYTIKGEGITLGAGGLTASTTSSETLEGGTTLEVPIALGAPQTWSLDGNDNDANGVFAGTVTGAPANTLGVDLTDEAQLGFGGNVGPVTITGENAANVGSTASANGAVALSGSSLNGTDGEAVSVTDAGLDANGPGASVGPLTTNGAFVSVGGLVGGGDLTVDGGVTLDSASVLQLSINGPGNGYSQLRASAAINLANAQLVLEGVKPGLVQGECPTLTAGQVDTLITTIGSLVGTFAGVPNGGTVKLSDCTGAVPTVEIHYTAHTVTATVVAPSFTWSGAGAPGSDWSSSANWGGSAPSGEVGTLTFPVLTSAACTANPATDTCYESTNDLAGLEANALSISAGYSITGSAFTLGSGGITTNAAASPPFGSAIDTPITLTAPQSWTIDGGEYAGLTVSNKVTGPSDALAIDLGHGSLEVIDDVEAGAVTVTGAYRLTLWGPGSETAKLNATDDNHVNFSAGTELVADNGAIGPLTLTGAGLYLSNLGNVNSAGGLSVAGGVTLGNTFTTEIVKSGNVAGTDYGQLTATGPINLDSAQLTLFTSAITGMGFRCLALTPGEVYTLATTAGALSGTFDGVPDGATVSGNCGIGGGTPPTFQFNYTTHAVTATVLTGGSDETEEESAARKKGEEEVAAKKSEEETAAKKKAEEEVAPVKTGGGTNPGGGSTTGGGSSTAGSTTGSGTSTAGGADTGGKSPVASAKPLTQTQKLAKALRVCEKEKPKSNRKACEAQAKKRYKPKPKPKVKKR